MCPSLSSWLHEKARKWGPGRGTQRAAPGLELGQAEPGESSGERSSCPPGSKAPSGRREELLLFRKQRHPPHPLSTGFWWAPSGAAVGKHAQASASGLGYLALLIRGLGILVATSHGSHS